MFPLENKVHKKFLALFHMCMKKPLGSSQKFLFVKQRRHPPPPQWGTVECFPFYLRCCRSSIEATNGTTVTREHTVSPN